MKVLQPAALKALLLPVLLATVFSACAPITGGPCSYRTSLELARVEQADDAFRLILQGPHAPAYPFDAAAGRQDLRASAGDAWHVIVRRRTAGACTPLMVSLVERADAGAPVYKVYFASDTGEPSPAEKAMLAAFARRHAGCAFRIAGHADETGPREYNLHLALRMAESVAHVLQNAGVAQDRLETIPFGEERPQSESRDADARHALNRRVEVVSHCDGRG